MRDGDAIWDRLRKAGGGVKRITEFEGFDHLHLGVDRGTVAFVPRPSNR